MDVGMNTTQMVLEDSGSLTYPYAAVPDHSRQPDRQVSDFNHIWPSGNSSLERVRETKPRLGCNWKDCQYKPLDQAEKE